MKREWAKLHGTVQKVIPPRLPSEAEKIEIIIYEADPLYKEIRVENNLVDEFGNRAILKAGSAVEIVLEADLDSRIKANRPLLQSVV